MRLKRAKYELEKEVQYLKRRLYFRDMEAEEYTGELKELDWIERKMKKKRIR